MIYSKVYGKENKGDWIVLLHGIGGSSTVWFRQLKLLKKSNKILLIDLPSHGKSSDIVGNKWSIKQCAREVEKEIKRRGIENYHLMGLSLGTLIIHEMLKNKANNILSVICVGTIIKFNSFGRTLAFWVRLLKKVLPIKLLYPLAAYVLLPKYNHRDSRIVFIKESKKVKSKEFRKWIGVLGEVEAIYTEDCFKDIKKYYISGEEDHIFIKGVKRNVVKDPNAELIILKNTGHVCNVDSAVNFNKVLTDILSNQKKVVVSDDLNNLN